MNEAALRRSEAFRSLAADRTSVSITELDARWSDAEDPDVRCWQWLPKLGPTSTMLGLRLVHTLGDAPAGAVVELDLGRLADLCGVGFRGGKNNPLVRALDRLLGFDLVRWYDNDPGLTLHVATKWREMRPDWRRAAEAAEDALVVGWSLPDGVRSG